MGSEPGDPSRPDESVPPSRPISGIAQAAGIDLDVDTVQPSGARKDGRTGAATSSPTVPGLSGPLPPAAGAPLRRTDSSRGPSPAPVAKNLQAPFNVYGPMKMAAGLSPRAEANAPRAVMPADTGGNYLFTVGLPSRGKSTFQRHLIWYLDKGADPVLGPEHKLVARSTGSEEDLRFGALKMDWDAEFAQKKFPQATARGRVTEFYFRAHPLLWKQSPPLDFGLYEIAGEHFQEIYSAAREAKAPIVRTEIQSFLESPDQNVVFALLANGLNYDEDDMAFASFLQYLRTSPEGQRYYEGKGSLALVIADPPGARQRILTKIALEAAPMPKNDDGRQLWESEFPVFVEGLSKKFAKEELQIRFLNTFFSQTIAEIQLWNTRVIGQADRGNVFFFGVGEVEEEAGVTRIVREDFRDAKAFYSWMYRRFTGRSLEQKRYFEKVVRFFSSLGGRE